MAVCVMYTTKIHWGYAGNEAPKEFRIKAGRSSGVYGTVVPSPNSHTRSIPCENLNYDGLGTYYVKVFAVDKDNNEVGGDEFVISLVNPSDSIVAPGCIRFVNNE